MIRLRAKWVGKRKKPTQYFFNLKSRTQRKVLNKTIEKAKIDKNQINRVYDYLQILQQVEHLNENLCL